MKFIRHTGQTIATTVIRTPTVEKKRKTIVNIVLLLLLVLNVDMIYAVTFMSILDCCAFKL